MSNLDAKLKHLDLIQGVINRMGSNSFLFKGWSITLIAAISAFAAKNTNPALMTVPVVSTILFWAIDGYYLMLERAFRNIYNKVRLMPESEIDFDLTPSRSDKSFKMWLRTLIRPVLVLFYGVVLIMLIILILILNHIHISIGVHHGT